MANGAGISEKQRVTAVRVANVPDAEFDAAVESDDPPTVTQLSEMGRKGRTILTSPKPAGFAIAGPIGASLLPSLRPDRGSAVNVPFACE